MARDLQLQANERQRKMQAERDRDLFYGMKAKQEVADKSEKEKRQTQSLLCKHSANQKELVRQMTTEQKRK